MISAARHAAPRCCECTDRARQGIGSALLLDQELRARASASARLCAVASAGLRRACIGLGTSRRSGVSPEPSRARRSAIAEHEQRSGAASMIFDRPHGARTHARDVALGASRMRGEADDPARRSGASVALERARPLAKLLAERSRATSGTSAGEELGSSGGPSLSRDVAAISSSGSVPVTPIVDASSARSRPATRRAAHEYVVRPYDEHRHGDRADVEPRARGRRGRRPPSRRLHHTLLERGLADDLHRLRAGRAARGPSRSARSSSRRVGRVDRNALLRLARFPRRARRSAPPRPPATTRNSLTFSGSIPASQSSSSRPGVPNGATPTRADCTHDPLGKEGRAGEHVRAAARAAGHAEPIEAELVGEQRPRRRPRRPRMRPW